MKLDKTAAEWRAQLTPQQYEVARERATERAFSGEYWDCHEKGIYRCVCCGAALFSSRHKFDSGSGWPSFCQAAEPANLATLEDNSHFMRRTEALCSQCGAHLGHVFADGPPPTGLRFCINSASLRLERDGRGEPEKA
jgi:peptide-methionine (R)-S-oxide reductase